MKLDEALTLRMSFNDLQGEIRVDENGYICLNDLAQYFPHKKIKEWMKNKSANEFIDTVDAFLNGGNSPYLKSIVSKRGKYNGGTYAHELIAMEFCTWLSPEFKLKVFLEYTEGRQHKKGWNIKRHLASFNYKMMSKSVENAHDPAKGYHYSNEAKMLNKIVFGEHKPGIRDEATEQQLDDIAWIEGKNSAYIDIDMDYQKRKEVLKDLYHKRECARILKPEGCESLNNHEQKRIG